MALTYLNSQMIEIPANINNLTVQTLSTSHIVGGTTISNNLSCVELNTSDINLPTGGGSIFNNVTLYGDLTITGNISALSGLEIIPTTFLGTTALSVANAGAELPLFVHQTTPSVQGVAAFKGMNSIILKVNNPSPDNYQPGVLINYPYNGAALKVAGNSNNTFVVTSGNRVGVNTDLPESELEVNGKITTTTSHTLTSFTVLANAADLSAFSIVTNKIVSNDFITDTFQTTETVVASSFCNTLTAVRGEFDKVTSTVLNVSAANIEVLNVLNYEASGFDITGNLNILNTVTCNTLTAANATINTVNALTASIPEIFGTLTGDLIGTAFGSFTGVINAAGSLDGNLKINPGTTTPPATSTSVGSPGQLAFDTNYLYICVASNTWKRVALPAWT